MAGAVVAGCVVGALVAGAVVLAAVVAGAVVLGAVGAGAVVTMAGVVGPAAGSSDEQAATNSRTEVAIAVALAPAVRALGSAPGNDGFDLCGSARPSLPATASSVRRRPDR